MARPSLLDQVRERMRLCHFSIHTEDDYVNVIRCFILYHRKRHPLEMGRDEIRQHLSHLATDENVAASTLERSRSSPCLFLYREMLLIVATRRRRRARQTSTTHSRRSHE